MAGEARIVASLFPTLVEHEADRLTRPLEYRAITPADVRRCNWGMPRFLVGGVALCEVNEHVRKPLLWFDHVEWVAYRDSVRAGQYDERLGADVEAHNLISLGDSKVREADALNYHAIVTTSVYVLRNLVANIKSAPPDYYPEPGISDIRDVPTLTLIRSPSGFRASLA